MLGQNATNRKGKAKPRPSASKTAMATYQGWVMANPTADAMNGAVQGVATTVANAPVKNEPA